MNTQHTPGEWIAENFGRNEFTRLLTSNNERFALLNLDWCKNKKEANANARLIAAAPDLLEALVNVLNWHKAHEQISFLEEEAIKKAEAAIQKATK